MKSTLELGGPNQRTKWEAQFAAEEVWNVFKEDCAYFVSLPKPQTKQIFSQTPRKTNGPEM